MKRILKLVVPLAFVFTVASSVPAQDLASSVVGVWKLTSQTIKEEATGATVKPFGEKPTGHWVFTRDGHFTWMVIGYNRKVPAAPAVTDAERVELFQTLSFGSGTYKVEGDKVAFRYETSWIESWTGTERKAQVLIAGKTLSITSAAFKDPAGKDVVTTWERID